MRTSLVKWSFLIALVMAAYALVRPVALPAQTGVEGHWEGAIELPGTALQIRVDFKSAGAALQANIDIPQQGARELALQAVRFAASQVHFELQAGPGLAVFEGKLEGDKISGNFSQAGQTFPFSLERKSAAAPTPATPAPKPTLDGLDDFITQAMKDWKVPGLALAVVQGDKVILLKGYGYRDLDKQMPVTPNTLFAIGSITKSFTVTALGMEMDEGKIDWDKPVRDYLPTFKMYTPELTEAISSQSYFSLMIVPGP